MNLIDFINKHPSYVIQHLQNSSRTDLIRDCINGLTVEHLTLIERKFTDPNIQKENDEWGHYNGKVTNNLKIEHVSDYEYTVTSNVYSKDIIFKLTIDEKAVVYALSYYFYRKAINTEYELYMTERANKANEIYHQHLAQYGITPTDKLIESCDIRIS